MSQFFFNTGNSHSIVNSFEITFVYILETLGKNCKISLLFESNKK